MLKVGDKIKALRKKQDVTQEKLAAYLNISYQAVSKWENGTALPDLTLIPGIANFFGVSADELLGMKDTQETKELKEFEKKYSENFCSGKIYDNIVLCRKVLGKYPRNHQWMMNLASVLCCYNDTDEHNKYSKEHDFRGEAIRLCERILEDCTEESVRHRAIQTLCLEYPWVGKKEQAIKLAMDMPDMYICREQLLSFVYEGEERIEILQSTLLKFLERCADFIWLLIQDPLMGKEMTVEQKIECMETACNLLNFVFKEDEETDGHNSMFYLVRLSKLWCEQGNADMAMKTLLQAEKTARSYDRWASFPEATKYKSVLLNRCVNNPKSIGKNYECTNLDIFRREIKDKHFDFIRDTDTFRNLLERLKEL